MPATHAVHVEEELAEEYLPATHAVHVEEELVEYVPATHAVHVDEEELVVYLPAGQAMHSAVPVWLVYLPAMHAHVDEEELVVYLPAGQAMHSAVPVWLLYLPAMHGTQAPPLGPDEPALHVQSSTESLPDGEFAWVGQLEHVEEEELAAYVPAQQFAHDTEPDVAAWCTVISASTVLPLHSPSKL